MTALDFAKLGGRIERTWAGLRALAPKGASIAAELRAEVARRVNTMREMPPATAGYGKCDGCGDAMPHYVAGLCSFCALARQKALRAWGVA